MKKIRSSDIGKTVSSFATLLCCVLTGVTSSAAADDTPVLKDATFAVALPTDPGSLDPHHATTFSPFMMRAFSYEGLVTRDPDHHLLPGLAESWTVTSTSVTYVLREGITCADGTPLSAKDVANNFSYIANPENGSTLLGAAVSAQTQVEYDDQARTITLSVPVPNSFLVESTGPVPIVCRHGFEDRSILVNGTDGTGMFYLAESKPNDHYTYKRRENYFWGENQTTSETPGVPETVIFRVISNQTTAANLLLAGQLTAANVSGPDRVRLEAADFIPVKTRAPVIQMWYNQSDRNVTTNIEMRRALSMAVDVAAISKVAGYKWGLPPRRLAGADPMGCPDNILEGHLPEFDPAQAKAILDGLGWLPGRDGIRVKDGKRLSLSLIYDREILNASFIAAAVELASAQWRDVGVEIKPRSVAGAIIGEVLFATSDYDISWVPVIVPLTHRLMMFASGATPPNGLNFPHVQLPGLEEMAAEANQMTGDASCPIWNKLEQKYLDNYAVLPIMDSDMALYTKQASFVRSGLPIMPNSIRMKQ